MYTICIAFFHITALFQFRNQAQFVYKSGSFSHSSISVFPQVHFCMPQHDTSPTSLTRVKWTGSKPTLHFIFTVKIKYKIPFAGFFHYFHSALLEQKIVIVEILSCITIPTLSQSFQLQHRFIILLWSSSLLTDLDIKLCTKNLGTVV